MILQWIKEKLGSDDTILASSEDQATMPNHEIPDNDDFALFGHPEPVKQSDDDILHAVAQEGVVIDYTAQPEWSTLLNPDTLRDIKFSGTIHYGLEPAEVYNFLEGPVRQSLLLLREMVTIRREKDLLKLGRRLKEEMDARERVQTYLKRLSCEADAIREDQDMGRQRYDDMVDVLRFIYEMFDGAPVLLPEPPQGILVKGDRFAGNVDKLRATYGSGGAFFASQIEPSSSGENTVASQPDARDTLEESLFEDDLFDD